jgi:hypothetical protein
MEKEGARRAFENDTQVEEKDELRKTFLAPPPLSFTSSLAQYHFLICSDGRIQSRNGHHKHTVRHVKNDVTLCCVCLRKDVSKVPKYCVRSLFLHRSVQMVKRRPQYMALLCCL